MHAVGRPGGVRDRGAISRDWPLVSGLWYLATPWPVERLTVQDAIRHESRTTTVLIGCFGAQVMLCGMFIVLSMRWPFLGSGSAGVFLVQLLFRCRRAAVQRLADVRLRRRSVHAWPMRAWLAACLARGAPAYRVRDDYCRRRPYVMLVRERGAAHVPAEGFP